MLVACRCVGDRMMNHRLPLVAHECRAVLIHHYGHALLHTYAAGHPDAAHVRLHPFHTHVHTYVTFPDAT